MSGTTTSNAESMLVATFRLSDAVFGVDTLQVQEVVRPALLTPVHQASPHILGIMNLRGKIVTVLDLGRKLGLSPVARGPDNRILIFESKGEHIGLLVERVDDAVTVENARLTPPPANVRGAQGRFFAGVLATEREVIAVIHLQAVLADETT